MRSYLGRKCLCCEACPGCPEFKKVVSEAGFEIYRYVKCVKHVCSDKKLLETHCVVFNNKQDLLINSNELLIDIEASQISCQHCKNIFKQFSNILQGTAVNKSAIIFICDNCVNKGMKYDKQCKFCKEIYDKLISSRISLKSKTKSDGTKWISEIRRLLSNKRKIEIGHEKISYLESPLHICATTNSKQDILGNVSEERIIKDKQSFKYVFPKINMEHRDLIKYTSSTELVKDVREQTKIKTDIARKKLELNETTKISKRKRTSPSRVAIEVENKYIQKIESDSKAGKTINIHNRRLQGGRDINELASTKPKLVESYSGDRDVMAKYTNLTINEGKKTDVGKGEKNHLEGVKDSGGDIDKKDKLKSKSFKKSQLVSNTKESERKTNGKSLASELIKRRKNTKEKTKLYPNDFDKKGKLKSQISKESQLKGNTKQAQRKTKSKSLALEGLNLHRVKVRKASIDDLQLNTVKVKHSTFPSEKRIKLTQLSDLNISPTIIPEHQTHKSSKSLSDLDSELDDIDVQRDRLNEVSEIIIGQKILKRRAPFYNKINKKAVDPMLFESSLKKIEINLLPKEKNGKNSSVTEHISGEQESPKGAIRYALSDRSFIENGWTMLPTEKIVRKLNVYSMKPARPEFDWFEHNKNKKVMYYDTGEMLAEFDEDGRGRWFYKNGRLALDYYNAKETNAGKRYVVYSNGDPDDRRRVRPITVLAMFDYLGNGVVFDHTGKIRLKYNQTEGVIMDRGIGPISHWKWHELNDPPVLQKVMTDTQLAVKDPDILKLDGTERNTPRRDNEEMLAIEFDNFIKEKSKKLTQKFKPFQITTKALKINEHFSLRVLDQATVYLLFRDGTTNLKLNLGMILDHQEIVDTDTAEVGEVATNMERFPARTDSLAMLQRIVANAQHVEKLRIERERRFRFTANNSSIDCIHTALSRPLQPPMNSIAELECFCKLRKSKIFNIGSDTNLI